MDFRIGDRVRSKRNDYPGLEKGECGIVVGYDAWEDAVVEWDEYNERRHDADGLTREGHGWFTMNKHLEIVFDNRDFGQLPEVSSSDMTKFLFDM